MSNQKTLSELENEAKIKYGQLQAASESLNEPAWNEALRDFSTILAGIKSAFGEDDEQRVWNVYKKGIEEMLLHKPKEQTREPRGFRSVEELIMSLGRPRERGEDFRN